MTDDSIPNERLWTAFLGGFMASGEGWNGEMTRYWKENDSEEKEMRQLRREFNWWLDEANISLNDSIPVGELREFINRMEGNANKRDTTETQDKLAALEQYWVGELESLIEDHTDE